jgi:hypothetical protein
MQTYYERRLDYLRDKFKLANGLELENEPPRDKSITVAEIVKLEEERQRAAYQVAWGSCTVANKDLTLALEIKF